MTLTLTRCCADEGFACYLNKSHHVGTIMGLTSNRSSAPKVHVNRSHHVLWFAQCRPVNRTVCATHHHAQWGHAAAAATPQSSNSSAGRRLAASVTFDTVVTLTAADLEFNPTLLAVVETKAKAVAANSADLVTKFVAEQATQGL